MKRHGAPALAFAVCTFLSGSLSTLTAQAPMPPQGYGTAGPPPMAPAPARPGAVNYVEGQVQIDGAMINANSIGQAALNAGQSLQTHTGRAEILLAPGVFLRVGNNSKVTMVSPDITRTEVRLISGKADVEVDQIFKENLLLVDQGPSQTQLLKTGLYAFNTSKQTVRVFDGEASTYPDSNPGTGTRILVKSGHKLLLNGADNKPEHFDKDASHDGLYAWSSLRSEYLGIANQNIASEYAGVDGVEPGWFWDPAFDGYSWFPGDGMLFSPFGFGFYSPGYIEGGGFIYGRGGYGYHGGYGHPGPRPGAPHPGFSGGGFHGAPGGGFHGGGGGFHGGGAPAGGGPHR